MNIRGRVQQNGKDKKDSLFDFAKFNLTILLFKLTRIHHTDFKSLHVDIKSVDAYLN